MNRSNFFSRLAIIFMKNHYDKRKLDSNKDRLLIVTSISVNSR